VTIDTGLLERDAEWAAVEAAAGEARRGRGRLLIVEGEAGIGKTRLLSQAGKLNGVRVLKARGSDLESPFAFGVVRQLFEPVLQSATQAERRRLLSGAAAQARRVFEPDDEDDTDAELATLHGLFWLTANLCEQPTVIVVDDLHWADTASVRFLAYLQPRLPSLQLLALTAIRTGEQTENELLLARLAADPDTRVLRPAELSAEATERLLAQRLGQECQPAFAKATYRATNGNPLLVHALAGALSDERVEPLDRYADQVLAIGHRAVARLVALRLAGLPKDTLGVARALAVLGQDIDVGLLTAQTGTDALTTAESLTTLQRMGLVEATTEKAAYVHPLVAAAVYADIGVRDLAAAHAKAADVLDRAGAPPEQVGAHLLKVPAGASDDAAVGRLKHAAETALHRGSAEAAYAFLRRALDEPTDDATRQSLLIQAATVAIQVDLNAAVSFVEEARRHTRDPRERAHLGLQLGVAHGFLHDPDQAVAALVAARDELPPSEEDLRRRLEATLLVGAVIVPDRTDLAERVPTLAALPKHDSLGARMLSATIALHEAARCDPAGAARARAAVEDGELVRLANGEGALVAGWIALLAADDPAGLASLDAAVAQAHQRGSLRALAAAYCFRAAGRLFTGQLTEADADARAALDLVETGRVDMDPSFSVAYLASSLVERGELDEAERILREEGLPYADPTARPGYYAWDAWATLLLVRNRPAEALAAARIAGDVWRAYGFDTPALGAWRSTAAQAAHQLGDDRLAERSVREELELARRWGGPRAHGRALRVLGSITGDLATLREAVDVLDDSPARLERAAALLELGAAMRRSGHRVEARDLLGRALDEAEICAASPLVERAAAELRVAGFRPRRNRLTGREALTASELRVAELAAAGATNREIAQSLFVTVKTVELHLSNAYRKLGVSRRTELAKHLSPQREASARRS
jgi:DNA-binding CsgD family transcriptional regulator